MGDTVWGHGGHAKLVQIERCFGNLGRLPLDCLYEKLEPPDDIRVVDVYMGGEFGFNDLLDCVVHSSCTLLQNVKYRSLVYTSQMSQIGKTFYLDRDQCAYFGVDYAPKGTVLECAADALLRSKEYDAEHRKLFRSLNETIIVAEGQGHGWFKIKNLLPPIW